MIGLIGAMEMGISGLVACMEQTQTESVSGILFYIGTIEGMPCVVAKCGAGKVNAAICAEAMILKYAPEKAVMDFMALRAALAQKLKSVTL